MSSSSSDSDSSSSSSSPEQPPPPRKRKAERSSGASSRKRRRKNKNDLVISELYNPPTWSTLPKRDSRWLLRIYKSLSRIGIVPLFESATFTTFGRHKKNDFPVMHQSCSRLHAVIQHGNGDRVYLYDVSTHGTKLNGEKIDKKEHTQLKVGDKVQFGESTRIYVLEPDERPEPGFGGTYGHLTQQDIESYRTSNPGENVANIKESVQQSHKAVLESLLGGSMSVDANADSKEDYLSRMKARSRHQYPQQQTKERKGGDHEGSWGGFGDKGKRGDRRSRKER